MLALIYLATYPTVNQNRGWMIGSINNYDAICGEILAIALPLLFILSFFELSQPLHPLLQAKQHCAGMRSHTATIVSGSAVCQYTIAN